VYFFRESERVHLFVFCLAERHFTFSSSLLLFTFHEPEKIESARLFFLNRLHGVVAVLSFDN